VANQVNIVINAQDRASQALGRINDKAKSMRGTFLKMGAAGGAIVGALGLLTKSAMDQEIGINKLDSALKNVNTSYKEQTQAIETTIRALQDKTNFGDEVQRDALTQMIRLTGDYETSLQALPVVMDLAEGAGMDFKAATVLMGKALTGETSSLSRYGIKIESTATATEILAKLTDQFGGAAEAAFDPLEAMRNEIGDLGQEIGMVLLPMIQDFLKAVIPAIKGMVEWASANPKLTKTLVLVTAGVGALLLSLGILGLALPPLIAGVGLMTGAWATLTAVMMANPIGLMIIAIATGFIATIAAAKGLDKLIQHIKNNWDKWVRSLKEGLNVLIDKINAFMSAIGLGHIQLRKFNTELAQYEAGATSLEDTLSTTNGMLAETGTVVHDVAKKTENLWKHTDVLTESTKDLTGATKELGKTTTRTVEKMTQGWTDYGLEISAADDVVVARKMMNLEKIEKETKRHQDKIARENAKIFERYRAIAKEHQNEIETDTKKHQDNLTAISIVAIGQRSNLEKMLAQLKVGELDRVMEYYRKNATTEGVFEALTEAITHGQIGMDENVLPGAGKGLPTLTGGRGYTLPHGGLFNVDRTKQLTYAGLQMWEALGTKDKSKKALGMSASELYQDENVGKYFTIVVDPNLTAQLDINASSTSLNDKMGNTPIRWQGNAPLKD